MALFYLALCLSWFYISYGFPVNHVVRVPKTLSFVYAQQSSVVITKKWSSDRLLVKKYNLATKLYATIEATNTDDCKERKQRVFGPLIEACVMGLIIAPTVLFSKHIISTVDQSIFKRFPVYSPLIGGVLIAGLSALDDKISRPTISKLSSTQMPTVSPLTFSLRWIGFLISIGSGMCVGVAGPAAEIGMVVAYLFQVIKRKTALCDNVSEMIVAGAGAGMATNFNAPLTGVLYAKEVTSQLTDKEETKGPIWSERLPMSLIVSVVCAVLMLRKGRISSNVALLKLPNDLSVKFGNHLFAEILSIVGIGLTSGTVFHIYSVLKAYLSHNLYGKMNMLLRPIVAGSFCALSSLAGYPQTLSSGFSTVNAIHSSESFPVDFILKFFLLKLFLVSSSSVAGVPGGQLAPLLFLGASCGALYHKILGTVLPLQSLPSIAVFSLVGAGSLVANNFKANLLGTIMILELTKSWELSVACLLSSIVSAEWAKFLGQGKK